MKAAPVTDESKKDKPRGPKLVPPDAGKKRRKRLSADEQFNNLCKAMAEDELFESGALPHAKDVGEVREELDKLERSFVEEEAKKRRKDIRVVRKPREL